MTTKEVLDQINAKITANGSKSITGSVLNEILVNIVGLTVNESQSGFIRSSFSDCSFQVQNGNLVLTVIDAYVPTDVLPVLEGFSVGILMFANINLHEKHIFMQVQSVSKTVFNGESYQYRMFCINNDSYMSTSSATSLYNVPVYFMLL